MGVPREDMPEGEEKFVLTEGMACRLGRPGLAAVYFEVPVRVRPVVEDGDVVIRFD